MYYNFDLTFVVTIYTLHVEDLHGVMIFQIWWILLLFKLYRSFVGTLWNRRKGWGHLGGTRFVLILDCLCFRKSCILLQCCSATLYHMYLYAFFFSCFISVVGKLVWFKVFFCALYELQYGVLRSKLGWNPLFWVNFTVLIHILVIVLGKQRKEFIHDQLPFYVIMQWNIDGCSLVFLILPFFNILQASVFDNDLFVYILCNRYIDSSSLKSCDAKRKLRKI